MEIKSLHKFYPGQKLKVCAYARISTNKDELETSLDEQIFHYSEIILSNPNWEFAGIFADDGISGGSINKRDQFQTMISLAKLGKIDIIIVKSISRFARNVLDLLETIQDLRVLGTEVIFEKERISTLDPQSDNYLTLYSKFAEEELISMSRNVNWRNQKNMRDGRYRLRTSQMLGYRYNSNNEIYIVEEEAKWIREIFERYAKGDTPADIADYLELNNVRTALGNLKWDSSSIRSILRNEKYCGDALLQKTYTVDVLTHKRLTNSGQKEQYLIKDAHPAIVERELWETCKKIREANADRFKIYPRNQSYMAKAFTGYDYCPYCGHYYFEKKNRDIRMVYCGTNRNRCTCRESESVFVEELKLIIAKQIEILKANESSFKQALIECFSSDDTKLLESEIKSLDNDINDLVDKKNKIESLQSIASREMKSEIRAAINEKMKRKNVLQNTLLTRINPEDRAKAIINELRALPSHIEDIEQIDYRKLLPVMVVRKRDDLIFIVGDKGVEKIKDFKSIKPIFKGKHEYKIRKTRFTTSFGIYIRKKGPLLSWIHSKENGLFCCSN